MQSSSIPWRLPTGAYPWLILMALWALATGLDRFWLALDQSIPAWDQADYLNGAMSYWKLLQAPDWQIEFWQNEFWQNEFWQRSSKIPPLISVLTALLFDLVGKEPDLALLVYLPFTAMMLASAYLIGRCLFNPAVGLWAAGLCLLMPGLYRLRLEFLLDYPLAAMVSLGFACLTLWRFGESPRQSWAWAIAFGVVFGLALLVKQPALLFLMVPLLGLGIAALARRRWATLLQWCVSLLIAGWMIAPWYRTNWLLMLTAGKRATLDSAMAEGEPGILSLEAWTYYWQKLPEQVTWPLLLVPLAGGLLYWLGRRYEPLQGTHPRPHRSSLWWLLLFLLGAYVLCSLVPNKDARYAAPYLPVLAVLLAHGLQLWSRRWMWVRWGTLVLAALLSLHHLFPIGVPHGSRLAQTMRLLSPSHAPLPQLGAAWPHHEVIDEIIDAQPLLRSTLGVLPSTPDINQHNFSYFGAHENFQVYGRQVGTRSRNVARDLAALPWFLTKDGDQGSIPDAQGEIVQALEQSRDFQVQRSWPLPDGSQIRLHRRRQPWIVAQAFSAGAEIPGSVRLEQALVPRQARPGEPIPVTYTWSGPWQAMRDGLVLLTWQVLKPGASPEAGSAKAWRHDHGIALGLLRAPSRDGQVTQPPATVRVTERLAMLPAEAAGTYELAAFYLNRRTGEGHGLEIPPVRIDLDPEAARSPAPELDLPTQLRQWARSLPQGPGAFAPMFASIARVSQYDPTRDYVKQAEAAARHRWRAAPDNLALGYELLLAQVLQRKAADAIATLQRVTRLDENNPYAHAYLAFVHLYLLQPGPAETALRKARALDPDLPEAKILDGAAALMQGNLLKAWRTWQEVQRAGVPW